MDGLVPALSKEAYEFHRAGQPQPARKTGLCKLSIEWGRIGSITTNGECR